MGRRLSGGSNEGPGVEIGAVGVEVEAWEL
jgi:hypothetical protein